METFVLTALAGFSAALVMAGVLYFIHGRGFAEADMIRAVGSIVTRNEEDAFAVGAAIHGATGVGFAFIYVGFWSLFPLQTIPVFTLFGVLAGAFHGLVVSFMLISVVAQHHPLPRFQQAGIGVGIAHFLAHVAYGAVVGWAAGYFGLRFDFIAAAGPLAS